MLIHEFYEIVEYKRKKQNKTLRYLSQLIGNKSIVYTRQVINGTQTGKAADKYRQIIADDLGIVLVQSEVSK